MASIDGPEHGWHENAPPTPGLRLPRLRELAGATPLVRELARKKIKLRYRQASFGIVWAVVQPVVASVVFTFVFARLANIDTSPIPYHVFAWAGFAFWLYFTSAVSAITESMVDHAHLVTKVAFPRLAPPAAVSLPPLVDLAVALAALLPVMAWDGIWPTWRVVLLPVALLLVMAFALGLGLLLATLNVRYRDAGHATPLILQVLLFSSPIAYPSYLIGDGLRHHLYAINPLVGALDLARWALIGSHAPEPDLAISAVSALAFLLAGLLYFARNEPRFADEL